MACSEQCRTDSQAMYELEPESSACHQSEKLKVQVIAWQLERSSKERSGSMPAMKNQIQLNEQAHALSAQDWVQLAALERQTHQ